MSEHMVTGFDLDAVHEAETYYALSDEIDDRISEFLGERRSATQSNPVEVGLATTIILLWSVVEMYWASLNLEENPDAITDPENRGVFLTFAGKVYDKMVSDVAAEQCEGEA